MNIHEYQAKQILKEYGVPVLDGYVASTTQEAVEAAKKLKSSVFVVKAQIHAGGRGKGGGVKIAKNFDEVYKYAKEILGMNLVTHQTGTKGKHVNLIYIESGAKIIKEFYFGITLDRILEKPVIMASAEGGVEIEKLAEETPEKIFKLVIDPLFGLQEFQARNLAYKLGFNNNQVKQFVKFALAVYEAYMQKDANLVEINPLALIEDDKLIALDAKMSFDDNALYRNLDVAKMRDLSEEDSAKIEAAKYSLNYIKLSGNVGCMVNGAGLAMATMDIIKHKGGEPANFLDVGGGASPETVAKGMQIILEDKNVKALFINIFGGIVRCDRIANGIIEATQNINIDVPVIVRLDGTNAEEAAELLKKSGIKQLISAQDLNEGAEKAVEIVKKS
ncbi:MAG: ADP-forming succinate--CoA ligase subunit beta [Bacteroidales bacterium]|nr:ADP-forming succinate--CoA ligase subunit beta [Bacteroidales bacterium]MDD4234706.1 ADP-forming succinate--CoA ligase subunit beta [Bacteroidales bacterium]